jgi:hypothetical protein
MHGQRQRCLPEPKAPVENIKGEKAQKGDEQDRQCARRPKQRALREVSHIASSSETTPATCEESFRIAYKMLT